MRSTSTATSQNASANAGDCRFQRQWMMPSVDGTAAQAAHAGVEVAVRDEIGCLRARRCERHRESCEQAIDAHPASPLARQASGVDEVGPSYGTVLGPA